MLAVAVCIGGGDVNEGLEVVHLLGQAEELLRGDHVQLQGVSAGKREKKRKTYCQTVCVCERLSVCVGVFARLLISLFEHLHARAFVFASTPVLHSNDNLQTSSSKHDYKPERKDTKGWCET